MLSHTRKATAAPGAPLRSSLRCNNPAAALAKAAKEASCHFCLYSLCLCISLTRRVPCRAQFPGSQGMTFPTCWPLQYKMVCLGLVLIHQAQSLYSSSGTSHARPAPVKAGCTHPLQESATPPDLSFQAVLMCRTILPFN